MSNILYDFALQDTNTFGKERPWKKWKAASVRASKALSTWKGEPKMRKQGINMGGCGSWLEFGRCPDGDGRWLQHADFCRVRMCPMCMWRKSRIELQQLKLVTETLAQKEKVRWVFLTLTMRNFMPNPEDSDSETAEKLSEYISHMIQSFHRLTKQRFWSDGDLIRGFYRTVEITRNLDRGSDWYGSYHPHIHVLLAVRPSYFAGRNYMSQKEWRERWRQALKAEYDPRVDIRIAKAKKVEGDPSTETESEHAPISAVLEATKYATKPNFVMPQATEAEANQTTRVLAKALHGKRLRSMGGMLKEIHKLLALRDVETADLAQDEELITKMDNKCVCPICQLDLVEEFYVWHQSNYFLRSRLIAQDTPA
jgi:Plasmid rolling circle replication initiator protein and truncated derivatives